MRVGFNLDELRVPAGWHRAPAATATHQRPFVHEDDAKAFVRNWLEMRDFQFEVEQPAGPRGRIDFLLFDNDKPSLGIEVKRDIDDRTNARTLADHFEQAQAYARALDCPVLLGPAMSSRTGMDLHHGGHELAALCALVIFGGRVNVGVAAFCPRGSATFVLRGKVGFRLYANGHWTYDQSVFRMARSVNSTKVRG